MCVCVVGGSRTLTLKNLVELVVAWMNHEMCDLALRIITVIHTYLNSCWDSVLNSVRCRDWEFGCIHNIFPFAV